MENEVKLSDAVRSIPVKPFLSFSIERILAKGPIFRRPERNGGELLPIENASPQRRGDQAKYLKSFFTRLPWLAYTRYCPPKIPRSKSRKVHRRHKLDRNPRIPFSSTQLATLEEKFLRTHYLSGTDVLHLSSALRVSEHRIKIWFQNRRAREKKMEASREAVNSKYQGSADI